jgi:predicted PurR-regulated permease PerM
MEDKETISPPWPNSTKMLVALTLLVILAALFIRFNNVLVPLVLAFMVAYLIYPIADFLRLKTKLPWTASVLIVYLVIILAILGLLVWGGLSITVQIGNMIDFISKSISNLQGEIASLDETVIQIGPFQYKFTNLNEIVSELSTLIQPLFKEAGSLLGTIATSAVSTLVWMFFVLMVSFFMVKETHGLSGKLINLQIPGYREDMRRMGKELEHIWNAFFRGQLILILITILIYTILLGGLRVRYFWGLAMIAGLARFFPYVGPAITWITYWLVAYFQGWTIFGMTPVAYAFLIVILGLIIDTMIDNIITPTLMGNTLKVHPAAVMVTVIIAASMLGAFGVMLAAPALATGKLVVDYSIRKLFDLDPWADMQRVPSTSNFPPISKWLPKTKQKLTLWLNQKPQKSNQPGGQDVQQQKEKTQ